VRAASVCVGNDSASFFGPQATEGNLRVSQTECSPGYVTRITNIVNLHWPATRPPLCSRSRDDSMASPFDRLMSEISARAPHSASRVYLYETRDQAPAQSLLGREIPTTIGAASNLLCVHICARDQLGEALFFQAQPVVDVGNHLLEHSPTTP
jgi:hypothetical protein